MTRKQDIIMTGVTVASLIVGGAGVLVGQKAVGQSEAMRKELAIMREQCLTLQADLEEAKSQKRISRNELVVTVKTDEYARRSLARQNRNFLNIKSLSNGQKWEGQIGEDRFGHAIFADAAYGFRAAAITLRSYEHKHGLRTLEELVGRFCQSNKTDYAKYLGKCLKIAVDKPFSYSARMHDLLVAMARWESGETVQAHKLALAASL